MTKPKTAASIKLLALAAFVAISGIIMQACNDSGDEPAESETPAASSADTLVPPDTTNLSDTLRTDTTKGGQPAPPR